MRSLRTGIVIFILVLFSPFANGQQCSYFISGKVTDTSGLPISKAQVSITNKQVITDKLGKYIITNICPGDYVISCTTDSGLSLSKLIKVNGDVQLNFILQGVTNDLKEVVVNGQKEKELGTLNTVGLNNRQYFEATGKTLAESLKNIPGLNSIQTGPSISKPVIHGLHSNRVLILNNGIRQEGQQWGSEHAPEIDPFTASHISVVEGAASIRYGSDALAGVVILEPAQLPLNKKIGGDVNLVGASNGRMGAASGMLEGAADKQLEGLQWRLQGTLKRAGNFKTASYYLKNTGLAEDDYSGTLAYRKKNYGFNAYYSRYNSKMGIFEGSHVGNINDLYAAFARSKPITASYFSYKIDRSYQQVTHDLLKLSTYYLFKNQGKAEIIYARQSDLRNEYDIELPYSNDPAVLNAPQISFKIKTHTLDALYYQPVKNNFSGTWGLNGITQGNVFRGIRYLVPNFRNYGTGIFGIEKYNKDKWTVEAGLRYDYRWLRVYRRNDNSLFVYNNTHTYQNVTASIGSTFQATEHFSISANTGTAWRAPSVNELYIKGIHLSAASYEVGDSTLKSERSFNTSVSFKYNTEKLFAQINIYDNEINNFIYARPSLQPITLVSGTYPMFTYTQADVRLRGLDAEIDYTFLKKLTLISKTSLVRAFNKTIHDYLVFMPADRFDNALKYSWVSGKKIKQPYISLQYVKVSRQNRVPPNSDYVAPPPGYGLLNSSMGCDLQAGKHFLNINFSVDNLTNVAYRDYLNRYRYYADDLGVSFVLRTKLSF
jgi:iron complex outermembrane receptor protein